VANAVAGAVVGSAMSQGGAEGWIAFYRRLNENVAAPRQADSVRVAVPANQWPSTIIGISGANYLVYGSADDRFLMMSSDDARVFIHSPISPSWREMNPKSLNGLVGLHFELPQFLARFAAIRLTPRAFRKDL